MSDILCLSCVKKLPLELVLIDLDWRTFSIYWLEEVLIGSIITKNIEVSSAKSFTWDSRLSDKNR